MRAIVFIALIWLAIGGGRATHADAIDHVEFDAFVRQAMADWRVPGVAVATIVDGGPARVVVFGQRNVESGVPVTPDTLFPVGSIAKSFTAAGLALFVDEGRLRWDTPVRDILPAFRLADPVASRLATVEDLLTHRTGMPRHDRLWYLNPMPRDGLFERLRHLDANLPFRGGFQYSNIMYMVAGRIAERLSDQSWESFVAERIAKPLGMEGIQTRHAAFLAAPDHAAPYVLADGTLSEIDPFDMTVIAPAGGLYASASDLIRWARYLMTSDADAPLLSADSIAALQSPGSLLPGEPGKPAQAIVAYGFGLEISRYRGARLVGHGGGIDGYIAHFSFMPEHDAAIVILSNLERNPVPTIVARGFYDRVRGLEPLPWSARFRAQTRKAEAALADAEAAERALRKQDAPPSRPLGQFVGRYRHAGYGVAEIALTGAGLALSYGRLTLPLNHVHHDIFEIEQIPLTSARHVKLTFLYNKAGEIDRLLIPFEIALPDIVFDRLD